MIRSGDKTVADWVVQTLIENDGNVMRAAESIGITARGLYKWVNEPRAHKTLQDNFKAHAFGRISFPAKLDEADIELVHKLRAEGKKMREIAKRFDVSLSAISLILSGKRRDPAA